MPSRYPLTQHVQPWHTVVPLYCCTVILWYHCTVVLPYVVLSYRCTLYVVHRTIIPSYVVCRTSYAVPSYRCTVVPFYCCTIVLLCRCIIVLLYIVRCTSIPSYQHTVVLSYGGPDNWETRNLLYKSRCIDPLPYPSIVPLSSSCWISRSFLSTSSTLLVIPSYLSSHTSPQGPITYPSLCRTARMLLSSRHEA